VVAQPPGAWMADTMCDDSTQAQHCKAVAHRMCVWSTPAATELRREGKIMEQAAR